MARRQQPERQLKRRSDFRVPKRVIQIFCEGEQTERQYFNELKRQPEVADRAAVDLQVQRVQGVPMTLVELACLSKKRADEVDEIWCVFDVEAKADKPGNHPNLRKAIDQAKGNDIGLAISNPCFELWLSLHTHPEPHPAAFLTTHDAVKLRQQLDGSADKEVDAAKYMPLRRIARDRAEALDRKHYLDGSFFPDNNPSSSVHLLLASVEP